MNKDAKQSGERARAGAEEQAAAFTALNGAMLGAFADASQAYLKGVAALNQEMMSFANARLRTNVDTGESLTKCESWMDAARLQQDWTRTAAEAYFQETAKLMELATHMTVESWAPVLERTSSMAGERKRT